MSTKNFTSADQATTTAALSILKGAKGQLRTLQVDGRYALNTDLKEEARPVIEAALAFLGKLAADIGEDTQLGCSGTPAVWAADFARDLNRLPV
jgi:hypothetical protein